MQLPTVPGILLTGGTVIIAYLANWLKSDGLPQRTNLIIGWVTVILLTVMGLLLTGNFTSDIAQDLLLGAVSVGALSQQLISLLQQAQKSPSPLLPARPVVPVPTQRASRAAGGPTSE